jgi:heterodisulfide reductase subunit C
MRPGTGARTKGGKAAESHVRPTPMEHEGHTESAFAGTAVESCYQCGKCTAGCPMAAHMDIGPTRLLRLVQLGQTDRAMRADAIWLCVSCQTCTARCPQSVDCCGVMDALREMAVRNDAASPAQKRVVSFQRIFLDNIRRNGRLSELELTGEFKTVGFFQDFSVPMLMKDSLLGPRLMARGKLHLQGEKVRDRGVVARIFDRCNTREAQS